MPARNCQEDLTQDERCHNGAQSSCV
jgi:hypothetical protein